MTEPAPERPRDIAYLLLRLAGASRAPEAEGTVTERDILRRLAINWAGDAIARDLSDLESLCARSHRSPAAGKAADDGPTLSLQSAVLFAYATFCYEGDAPPVPPGPGEAGADFAFAWQCLNAGLATLDRARLAEDALFLEELDVAADVALNGLLEVSAP